MTSSLKTDVMTDLLSGDPELSMEAAKHLVGNPSEINPAFLIEIVDHPGYKPGSKVAAAYVLGFLPLARASKHQHVLRKLLADAHNSVELRTHAAEALGNLRDEGSVKILGELLLNSKESTAVRKWCIYALGELNSPESSKLPKKFEGTQPHGVLAEELKSSMM